MDTHVGHERSRRRGRLARIAALSPARLLPQETRAHLRNATREQLLALRSVLDAVIARLERPEGKEPNHPTSGR